MRVIVFKLLCVFTYQIPMCSTGRLLVFVFKFPRNVFNRSKKNVKTTKVYFMRRNFRVEKVSRISRFLPIFAKVCIAKKMFHLIRES